MRAMIWNKLIVSAAINPLSAVLGVENGRLLTDRGALETLRRLALEAASVARAMGISSPACLDPVREVERVCRGTAHNVSSMLQDVRNGRRTEIEAITGMMVKEARAAGVAVPANEQLLAQVRKLEARNKRKSNET